MRFFRNSLIILIVLPLILFGSAAENENLTTGSITYGSRQISFLYPSECNIEDDQEIGFYVFQNETDWVSIAIPREERNGVEQLHENIENDDQIIELTENFHVYAVNNIYYPLSDPAIRFCDTVCVGLNLSDESGVLITANCVHGRTEIYDLFLTVISSMTETDLLEDWLIHEWIPCVLSQNT